MIAVALFLSLAQVAAPPAPPVPAAAAPARPTFVSRRGGRLFISPMGEPFRAKGREDDTLADWFYQANRSHDGKLTLQEMQQDAERFFALLDVNHDGEIDPDEITRYETIVAPEVQTGEHYSLASLEGDKATDGQSGGRGGHGGHGGGGGGGGGHRRGASNDDENGSKAFFRSATPDLHQGAARYGLLDLPEPVISADTDFDRGVSLAEFRAAAQQRFLALDLDNKGYLTLEGLESIRPAPPPTPNPPATRSSE